MAAAHRSVLTTDSALRHNIIGRYLILTTANMYNVTIVDLITGERMYSTLEPDTYSLCYANNNHKQHNK